MAPPHNGEDPGEEPVLSPEELDFAAEERVAELEEGRFVIGADGPPEPTADGAAESSTTGANNARSFADLERRATRNTSVLGRDDAGDAGDLSGRRVKRWIGDELDRTDSQYAYRIAAKTGATISHQQLASDDVGTAFDGLLRWYARQVADGTSAEEALGILLAESSIRVRYPITGLLAYLEANDLDQEDSIGDLLEAIRASDGLVFPLRDRR